MPRRSAGPVWVIDRDRRVPFVVPAPLAGDVYTPLDVAQFEHLMAQKQSSRYCDT